MRAATTLMLTLAATVFWGSCKKEEIDSDSCEQIRDGIINNNIDLMREEINRITKTFKPNPTSQDKYGHQANIDKLISEFNNFCGFRASLVCYNCIQTEPPKTEIEISVRIDSNRFVKKVIDLSYDRRKQLIFQNMHN